MTLDEIVRVVLEVRAEKYRQTTLGSPGLRSAFFCGWEAACLCLLVRFEKPPSPCGEEERDRVEDFGKEAGDAALDLRRCPTNMNLAPLQGSIGGPARIESGGFCEACGAYVPPAARACLNCGNSDLSPRVSHETPVTVPLSREGDGAGDNGLVNGLSSPVSPHGPARVEGGK